jgi:hypothetical protein
MIELLLGFWLCVQPPGDGKPDEMPVIKLTLPPTKLPSRALRYPLLPELRDTTPGNAAPVYLRIYSPEWYKLHEAPQAGGFLEMPLAELKKLPREKLPDVFSNAVKEADRGARREYCDWNLTQRYREDGWHFLAPEMQAFRLVADALELRARLEMIDGRLDKAHYTIQTGMALGRHVGEGSDLIQGLVGLSVCRDMLDRVDDFIQQPGAPNLYWSLTDLPRPLIDLRKSMQGERIRLDAVLPGVRELAQDAELKPLNHVRLVELLERIDQVWGTIILSAEESPLSLQLVYLSSVTDKQLRKKLVDEGFPADKVEKLPAVQVFLVYEAHTFDRLYDESLKWQRLPVYEGIVPIQLAEKEVRKYRKTHFIFRLGSARSLWMPELFPIESQFPLASNLLPVTWKCRLFQERLDRKVAILRTIEAIRLHALANDGKPPAKLEDIKVVPLPIDPFTGRPFEYHAEANKATLTALPFAGEKPNPYNSWKYELTLK